MSPDHFLVMPERRCSKHKKMRVYQRDKGANLKQLPMTKARTSQTAKRLSIGLYSSFRWSLIPFHLNIGFEYGLDVVTGRE